MSARTWTYPSRSICSAEPAAPCHGEHATAPRGSSPRLLPQVRPGADGSLPSSRRDFPRHPPSSPGRARAAAWRRAPGCAAHAPAGDSRRLFRAGSAETAQRPPEGSLPSCPELGCPHISQHQCDAIAQLLSTRAPAGKPVARLRLRWLCGEGQTERCRRVSTTTSHSAGCSCRFAACRAQAGPLREFHRRTS